MLEATLGPVRERRAEYARSVDHVEQVVRVGTTRGREVAARTMTEVRRAMQLNDFAPELVSTEVHR